MKIICKQCKKEFLIYPSRKKTRKFCSRKCNTIWRSLNSNGKNNFNWKGGGIKKICQICGKKFLIYPSRNRKGGGKFCSYKCLGIWCSQKWKYRGKLSPAWKGGITPILLRIRNNDKYKLWRSNIFIRDNFTCQKCGIKGDRIEAHHKKSFSKLIEEVKKYLPLLPLYEGAMTYTPLWDLDNGVTLCEKCHKKIKGKNK